MQKTLSIEYIVSYLSGVEVSPYTTTKKNNKLKIFPLPKNVSITGDQFGKFRKLFNESYFMSASLNVDNDIHKFIGYLLESLAKKEWEKLSTSAQKNLVINVTNIIKLDVTSTRLFQELKLSKIGWTRQLIIDTFKDNNLSVVLVHYLACYFDINIIIYDFDTETVHSFYHEDEYNKLKKTVIFGYGNKTYQLIKKISHNYFTHNDCLVSKTLSQFGISCVNVNIRSSDTVKIFIVKDDFSNYEPLVKKLTKKDDDSFDEILIDNRVKNDVEPVKTVNTVTESEVNLDEIVSEEPLDDDVDGSALACTDASAEPSTSKTEKVTTKEELMKNSKAELVELVEKKLNGKVIKGLKRKNKSQLVELILN